MNCAEAAAWLMAYVDRETDWLHAHAIRRHLQTCPRCTAEHDALVALRRRIRTELPRYTAPPSLRSRVRSAFEAVHAETPTRARGTPRRWTGFASGALAGCLATVLAWF